ncbi:MAG TPA: hypothetical protein VFS92_05420 [Planctomycetota bacterium]|nr:hypothetical protein [Planctomycetota bacterium]
MAPPAGGPSPEEEIARLAIQISKGLRENEEALARLARGHGGNPKAVDIDLPKTHASDCSCSSCSKPGASGQPGGSAQPGGAPQPGGATQPGGKPEPGPGGKPGGASGGDTEGLLRGSAAQGREIASNLDELLRQASRLGGQGGGGGGGGSEPKAPGGGDDPKEPADHKKGEDPTSGKKTNEPPEGKQGKKPPAADREPPPEIDPKSVFFAKLPDKVREAVTNGDFDQVPEKYRDLIREWTKALSEKDKKAAEAGGDAAGR